MIHIVNFFVGFAILCIGLSVIQKMNGRSPEVYWYVYIPLSYSLGYVITHVLGVK